MDKALEELRLLIASCSEFGQISKSDMDMLTVRARIMGLTPEELDVLIKTSGQQAAEGVGGAEDKIFAPRVVHIVIAVVLAVILAVLVFIGLDFGGVTSKNSAYLGLGEAPVVEADLYHLYSGTYDGRALLLTVKDVKKESNGKHTVVFDLKCDFVPVAQNCKCYVDLNSMTFDFEETDAIAKKIQLGSGTIQRTATGKVVFKPASGRYELLQL